MSITINDKLEKLQIAKESSVLDIEQVSMILRCSCSTIRRRVAEGVLPIVQHVKYGKWLFKRSDIEQFIDNYRK